MNPVLLKPTGERSSQVIVMGRPLGTREGADYQRSKVDLVGIVDDALADLRSRFDVVICEGAGSPAEINLLDHDIVNLGLAERAGIPAVVVGDIHRGGVFAHLYGTVALLPEDLRRCVKAFLINMFRGDPALLGNATGQLEERCGVPTLGVLPYLSGLVLDAEDSLHRMLAAHVDEPHAAGAELLDVVVLRLPRLSNFTDLDPLLVEGDVAVRFVDHPSAFGDPDLIVIPGTKSTTADLAWLGTSGLRDVVVAAAPCLLTPDHPGHMRWLPNAGPGHRGSRRGGVGCADGSRLGLVAIGHPVRGREDHTAARRNRRERRPGAGLRNPSWPHAASGRLAGVAHP